MGLDGGRIRERGSPFNREYNRSIPGHCRQSLASYADQPWLVRDSFQVSELGVNLLLLFRASLLLRFKFKLSWNFDNLGNSAEPLQRN